MNPKPRNDPSNSQELTDGVEGILNSISSIVDIDFDEDYVHRDTWIEMAEAVSKTISLLDETQRPKFVQYLLGALNKNPVKGAVSFVNIFGTFIAITFDVAVVASENPTWNIRYLDSNNDQVEVGIAEENVDLVDINLDLIVNYLKSKVGWFKYTDGKRPTSKSRLHSLKSLLEKDINSRNAKWSDAASLLDVKLVYPR